MEAKDHTARDGLTFAPRSGYGGKLRREWVTPPPPHVSKRPRCPGCLQGRRPNIRTEVDRAAGVVRCSWEPHTWHGYGHFCTLGCATRYANRRVDAQLGLRAGEPRDGLPP